MLLTGWLRPRNKIASALHEKIPVVKNGTVILEIACFPVTRGR